MIQRNPYAKQLYGITFPLRMTMIYTSLTDGLTEQMFCRTWSLFWGKDTRFRLNLTTEETDTYAFVQGNMFSLTGKVLALQAGLPTLSMPVVLLCTDLQFSYPQNTPLPNQLKRVAFDNFLELKARF